MAAVSALPDRERQVLVCRYFLDLSEADTVQVPGCPLGSVKSRTARALNRLCGLLVPGEQIYFEKPVHVSDVTQVQVKGTEGP